MTQGVDGLLVPARQSEPLARAIARVADDPALARRLGEAARAKALAEYDERIIVAKTIAVYDELMGQPRPLVLSTDIGGGPKLNNTAVNHRSGYWKFHQKERLTSNVGSLIFVPRGRSL